MKEKVQVNEQEKIQGNTRLAHIPTKELPEGYRRLRVQFDVTYKGAPGIEVPGESLTEPDMVMSVQQLLERHSRGQELPERRPVFVEVPVPTINDLTDVEEYRNALQEQVNHMNEFLKEEAKAAKKNDGEAVDPPQKTEEEQPAKTESKAKGKADKPDSGKEAGK